MMVEPEKLNCSNNLFFSPCTPLLLFISDPGHTDIQKQ